MPTKLKNEKARNAKRSMTRMAEVVSEITSFKTKIEKLFGFRR
jgi:hypothetical protein